MTKVINFIGGPCAGKSSLAGELFGWMKRRRYNVEYVQEFAKSLAWDKATNTLDDQVYLLGVQNHGLYSLLNETDYIITDSPIILTIEYAKKSLSKYDSLIKEPFNLFVLTLHRQYDNIIFNVNRGERKYSNIGRIEKEYEALQIDKNLVDFLENHEIPYLNVITLEDCLTKLQFTN